MDKRAARMCLFGVLATAVTACSSYTPKDPEPNVAPTNYRQEIVLTLSRTLDDPTNLRGGFLSDPVLTKVGTEQRYTACVRFNARDATYTYMGPKDYIAYFFGGHLNQLVEATKEQCGNAAYKPFPEIEKLCRANKCT